MFVFVVILRSSMEKRTILILTIGLFSVVMPDEKSRNDQLLFVFIIVIIDGQLTCYGNSRAKLTASHTISIRIMLNIHTRSIWHNCYHLYVLTMNLTSLSFQPISLNKFQETVNSKTFLCFIPPIRPLPCFFPIQGRRQ